MRHQMAPSARLEHLKIDNFLPIEGKKFMPAWQRLRLKCSFCTQRGHTNKHCPAAPYIPPQSDRLPFVEKLLALPRISTNTFLYLKPHEAVQKVLTEGTKLNIGNPWQKSTAFPDSLRKFLGFWKAIGSSNSVISWLGYGYDLPFMVEPPHKIFRKYTNGKDKRKADFADKEVESHLQDGCMHYADHGFVRCAEPRFVIEQNGKLRNVDDKRFTNMFLPDAKFSMSSLKKDIPALVQPGEIQDAKDQKKAYYHVPLSKRSQRYQAFTYRTFLMVATCLLFGMSLAPFVFTKICRPIVRFLGCIKLPTINFIDDWLWSGERRDRDYRMSIVNILFSILGWKFSDKDQTGTMVKFLGFIIDSVNRCYYVPSDKIVKTHTMLTELVQASTSNLPVTVGRVQTTVGKVISMNLAIPAVRLWCRSLYRQILTNNPTVFLTRDSIEEVRMLMFLLKFSNGSPFINPSHECELTTDASETHWGAYSGEIERSEHLPSSIIGRSSTHRELFGVLAAIYDPLITEKIRGKVVRLNMDSMCATRNILNGGGNKDDLVQLIKAIFIRCDNLGSSLHPMWLPRDSIIMVKADALSKPNTKWKLLKHFAESYKISPIFPELNQCKNAVLAAASRPSKSILILPRWEAQVWWSVLLQHAQIEQIPDISTVLAPNTEGLPRWHFVIATFN